MVSLGFEPWAAKWQAQTIPQSYSGLSQINAWEFLPVFLIHLILAEQSFRLISTPISKQRDPEKGGHYKPQYAHYQVLTHLQMLIDSLTSFTPPLPLPLSLHFNMYAITVWVTPQRSQGSNNPTISANLGHFRTRQIIFIQKNCLTQSAAVKPLLKNLIHVTA